MSQAEVLPAPAEARLTLVTAFFRLRDRAVDESELFRLFDDLAACDLPIILFLDRQLADRSPTRPNVRVVLRELESLWPFQQEDERPLPESRTPDKDTRDFILLQNAKLDLLASARGIDDSSHFAWIDFGIMKVVHDAERFRERLRALRPPASGVLAPGCWLRGTQASGDGVNWRFCGGFLVADRDSIAGLVARHHRAFSRTPSLTWEVNLWAEMERDGAVFDWYKADHDDSIVPNLRPRVCLVMIVKNEKAIIGRCLSAALPFIDCWSITDTGSTDGTDAAVESFFASLGIPGKLSRAPFENFAQARNASLRAAETVRGWDYALLIDADMVLSGELDRSKLVNDGYRLMQADGAKNYWNTRLVRRAANARYFGVTHEYLSVQGEKLEGLWIDDRNDGGSKGDKGERDIRLLRAGLESEPGNARYMFYLANTLRETGRHQEAIEWYGKRVAAGGWDEEVWCAQYYSAKSHQALGDEEGMLREAIGAYERRPSRGEPLKLLARHYRELGQNERALVFARTLKGIDYPSDLLFVERDAYEDGADEEISIAGFYSNRFRQEGYRACAELTVSFNPHQREQARKNATHYARSASDLFEAEIRQIPWEPDDGYAPMNPSVCVTPDDRRLVLVRTVNYTVTSQGQYPTIDGSGIIRTRNHVIEVAEDWSVKSSTIVEDASGAVKNSFPVEGFEDCRLWQAPDGSFRASATVRDLGDGRCEMAVLTLDDRWRVTGVDVVRDQEHDRPQKNWMPIVGRPGQFLYWCDPTIVVEREGGATREIARHEPNVCLVDQRGSSQVIPFQDGWLCLTHEVTWRPERVYLHRFLRLDASMRVTAVSDLFYFHQVGIEFCAGLALDGGRLVASFGVNDASAWVAFIDPNRVELWPIG